MIPYATFSYFGVLLYTVVPTVLLGLLGRVSWRWVLLVTAAMLAVQYGGSVGIFPQVTVEAIWLLAAYAVWEWSVALGFLRLRPRATGRAAFYLAILLALLPLLTARFINLASPDSVVAFLGLSYVTFRSLDVIIGIQDRLIQDLRVGEYLAFVFFFATISSGPIDRYRRFLRDWRQQRTRAEFLQDLDAGLHRVMLGFLYKFIVAALIKQYWLDPATSGADLISNISYMYAYSFYLFFDFAGYSLFAIGVSYLFGIHTPANFNRPFLARNISDFWNRWHISLSTWFRDHIYMRFMLASTKGRWFKNKYLGSYLGFFITFGLMGLWHGTALNYILYGLYHGALLSGHDFFHRWNATHKLWGQGRVWQAAEIFTTFNLVCFGFLIFSGHLGPNPAAAAGSSLRFQSAIESADCQSLRGYAWDRDHPKSTLLLNLYENDLPLLVGIVADQPSGSLDKTNAAHGFLVTVPARIKNGNLHTLVLRISGTNTLAGQGPINLTCE